MLSAQDYISLNDLIKERATFQIKKTEVGEFHHLFHDEATEFNEIHQNEFEDDILDEEEYDESQSFDKLAKEMESITEDSKVLKKLIRQGVEGSEPPKTYASVKIHYEAFLEHTDKPFDSTYLRKQPRRFIVNDGQVLTGLDIAVQSMKLHEKSQFLVHSDYAYGRNVSIGRIPPNSTILYVVELVEIVDTATIVRFEKLESANQQDFNEIRKYVQALLERAKLHVKNGSLDGAIKDYNTGIEYLKNGKVTDAKELKETRELLHRSHSNLLVCYTRAENYKKGCQEAKHIFALVEKCNYLPVSAKVYFNYAKCLRFLEEYDQANIYLSKALKLEPKNVDITNEMVELEQRLTEYKKKEKIIAEALMKSRLS